MINNTPVDSFSAQRDKVGKDVRVAWEGNLNELNHIGGVDAVILALARLPSTVAYGIQVAIMMEMGRQFCVWLLMGRLDDDLTHQPTPCSGRSGRRRKKPGVLKRGNVTLWGVSLKWVESGLRRVASSGGEKE